MKSCRGPFCLRRAMGWLVFLLLARPAAAVDYTVGVQDVDYYPIYASDPMGRYTGYARDLLDLFAKCSGVRLVYQARPVKRLVGWSGSARHHPAGVQQPLRV